MPQLLSRMRCWTAPSCSLLIRGAQDMVDFATLHVPLKVGTDIALINGMMNVLITENLYDKKYVDSCCTGFEELKDKGDGVSTRTRRRNHAALPPKPFGNWRDVWLR